MQIVRTMTGRRSLAPLVLRAAVVVGCAVLVCGCNTDQQIAAAPDVPTDYRLRHPITITEADRTLQLFIGNNRGALTPAQRAEVLAFAQTWKKEATGGVIIDLPNGTGNERASADALREIQSILAATGVPPQSMVVRGYRVTDRTLATVRITYPRIAAQAGPCGLWPEDVGPSMNRDYAENQPPWNLGCATQRNLAAMVDNPADLVEPRGETPPDNMRRSTVMDNYQKGNPTATVNPNAKAGEIATSVGQ